MLKGKGKNLGLALVIEVLGFSLILSVIIGVALSFYKYSERDKEFTRTKLEIETLFNFFRNLYLSNLSFIKETCSGYANCNYTLTPEPVSDTTFRVHIANLALLKTIKPFCQINQTGNSQFDITCYSAYSGQPFEVNIQNYQKYHQPFLAPYYGKYTSITITAPKLGFNATLVLDNEINKSLLDTAGILKTFKQAVENWAKMRLQLAIGNACGNSSTSPTDPVGGLGSWDDVLIPWIWQAFGYNPYTTTSRGKIPTLCQGIDEGCQCGNNCGCQNFLNNPNVWREDSNLCMVHSPQEFNIFLTNIGLSDSYMTDGFGNLLTFVPISNANDKPSSLCPPPPPSCCYPYDIPKKGTVGIYDYKNNRWVYKIEIIYP